MRRPGASRRRIVLTLNAAYADGWLSDETFRRRLDQLLKARVIDPFGLIGDLQLRRSDDDMTRPVGAILAGLQRVAAMGTVVNGARAGRFEVRPGDLFGLRQRAAGD